MFDVVESEVDGDDLLVIEQDDFGVVLPSEKVTELTVFIIDNFPGIKERLEDYLIYVRS